MILIAFIKQITSNNIKFQKHLTMILSFLIMDYYTSFLVSFSFFCSLLICWASFLLQLFLFLTCASTVFLFCNAFTILFVHLSVLYSFVHLVIERSFYQSSVTLCFIYLFFCDFSFFLTNHVRPKLNYETRNMNLYIS